MRQARYAASQSTMVSCLLHNSNAMGLWHYSGNVKHYTGSLGPSSDYGWPSEGTRVSPA